MIKRNKDIVEIDENLKYINKGIMKKDGRPYLPITHESLVVDNDGVSIDRKYVTHAYIRGLASEYYVEQYVDEYVTYHLEPIKDAIWNEDTGLLKRVEDLETTTREGGEIYESIKANKEAIETESKRAIEAEEKLNDAILKETEDRTEADTILDNKISDEITRAIAKETELENLITDKETELKNIINDNKEAIDILNGDVSVAGSVANSISKETERSVKIEEELRKYINENAHLIDRLNGSIEVDGSVKRQLKDVVDSANIALRKLCKRITDNKKSIDILNGEENVEGSVKNEVTKAVANIADELNTTYILYDEDINNIVNDIYKE